MSQIDREDKFWDNDAWDAVRLKAYRTLVKLPKKGETVSIHVVDLARASLIRYEQFVKIATLLAKLDIVLKDSSGYGQERF